jgi:hypothetical protein
MDTASAALDSVFFALSDGTRRALLARLLEADATAGGSPLTSSRHPSSIGCFSRASPATR